jgi:hypothetical protein
LLIIIFVPTGLQITKVKDPDCLTETRRLSETIDAKGELGLPGAIAERTADSSLALRAASE